MTSVSFVTTAVIVVLSALGTALSAQQAGGGAPAPGPKDIAVTKYAGAWNKTTEAEILDALKDVWTADSTYTDPQTNTARGPAALAQVILGFHKALPGATLKATSRLDTHHNVGRFSWHLSAPPPAAQESDGFDFVEFTPDGTKVLRIVGFFGPFPKL